MQLTDLMQTIESFVAANGWSSTGSKKPQTARNLATSISIESAELLECFQWSDDCEDLKQLTDELADVFIYSLRLAQVLRVDPDNIVQRKLEENLKRKW